MKLSSLQDILELENNNVKIKNVQEVLNKINRIIQDGHTKLQIVTDFDHTLTRHEMDDGEVVLTSFGMFQGCPSIPQHYKDKDNRLSDIYKPIEADSNISCEKKTEYMIEWYKAGIDLLKGLKFPRSDLKDVAQKMVKCFREGTEALATWSAQHRVPMLVFSAGLGDCVVASLRAAKLLNPQVQVISNFLDIDKDDTIVGMKGNLIHSCNKNETVIKGTEYYDMVHDRTNVILMGDNIGDAGMAEGMEHCDTVLRIGFLGKNVESNLPNYLETFDIVLINEHSLKAVNAIIERIL